MGSGELVLKYFTEPAILEQIGPKRLALLLRDFADDLKACQFVLPSAEAPNGDYFLQLAATFAATERLPEPLRQALRTLENAASPANDARAWAIIRRRIPGVSVSRECALDRVLELWFAARDELSQLAPPKPEQPRMEEQSTAHRQPRSADGPRPQHVQSEERSRSCESQSAPVAAADGDRPRSGEILAPVNAGETPARTGEDACPTADSTIQRFNDSTTGSANDSTSADSDEHTLLALAQLSPTQYDRARQGAAQRLGIRMETLDSEVSRRRADVQARAVKLPLIEPWPDSVDGAEVLHQVAARFSLQVVLPPGAAHAIALWDAHAHASEAFLHTPRLNLSSPESECGKTTTLDLLATMTPRALRTENLTAPVLFRLVAQHRPTLLLDEVDTYLTTSDELRGLLNAGHKRGACAYRCEGEGNAVRAFNAFAPAVLSGIGELPETLHDRSIRIWLLPAQPEQVKSHFDSRHHEIETVLCRKLARWTQDNFAALQTCDPSLPPGAYNRVADNWRPLFAIAHIAGSDWPLLAAEAYTHLTTGEDKAEALAGKLLADIRHIFTQTRKDRISSTELVNELHKLPGGQWLSALGSGTGKGPVRRSTFNWLGRQLGRFGIKARTIRNGAECTKGYLLADFPNDGSM